MTIETHRQVLLRSFQFRREREAAWRELEGLLGKVEKRGLRALSPAELERLPLLHRAALSGLSVARAISLDRNLLDYLESLAARAHLAVHATHRPLWASARDWALRAFPQSVRRFRVHLLLATLFFASGVATSALLTARRPELFSQFVSDEMAQGRDPTATDEELKEVIFGSRTGRGAPERPTGLAFFSGYLFNHNAQIGLMSFALGFAFGLPTFYLMFTNGLILGAFAQLYRSRGLGLAFWGWILPHGVSELTAMLLAGAGGLALAEALIRPGRRSRLDNLVAAGRETVPLLLGAVAMFFVAALFEGFFRQLVTDTRVRWAVAVAVGGLWALYFACAGRGGSRSSPP